VGESAFSIAGSELSWPMPAAVSTTNQTIITGPNARPMYSVPNFWAEKRTTRIAIVIGTTNSSRPGAATSTPSTADSTEMAGVIMPSP